MKSAFEILEERYGRSAATTYDWNRYCGRTAKESHERMLAQVKELGVNYLGGLECTKYRRQDSNPELTTN